MTTKNTKLLLAALLTGILSFAGFAAAPTNDNLANATTLSGIRVSITGTNVGATKETNEPNHALNDGGKSVWYKWTAPMARNFKVTTGRTGTNLDTLVHIYFGTNFSDLTSIFYNNDIRPGTNARSLAVFTPVAGATYYIAVDGASIGGDTAAEGIFQLDIQPYFMYQGADYDFDGYTELSTYRPSDGLWTTNGATRAINEYWGTGGDIPMVGSFSSVPARTVFRPSNGYWYQNSPNFITYIPFGLNGDIPVMENFTDSIGSYGVFRPSEGNWYIRAFDGTVTSYHFGQQGDVPVPGQYTPDPVGDLAVFRPSDGNWYFWERTVRSSQNGTFRAVHFGQQGDKPVPADYDGDGLLDVAIYRPSTGTWWVLQSSNSQVTSFYWGIAEDIPSTGDFDGDGKFDFAIFRPSTAMWAIYRSSDAQKYIENFGQPGDIPMTANKAF